MRSSPLFLSAMMASAFLYLGCDEEPIIIGPQSTVDAAMSGVGGTGGQPDPMSPGPGGMGGGQPPGPDMAGGAGGGGSGGGEQPPPEPDFDLFQSTVVSALYANCVPCHLDPTPDPADRPFDLVTGGPDGLDPAQQRLNFEETLAFVDFDDPASSSLLVFHGPGDPNHVLPASQTYRRVIAWIQDAIVPPPDPIGGGGAGGEGGGGGDGGAGGGMVAPIPCDGIPPPGSTAGRSRGYRDAFEMDDGSGETINEMLISSCGEAGFCHGTQAVGGGYWLVDDADDPCGVQWNYLTTQWFVDPLNTDASPLLTKPRERDHGGRVVFRGRDDPRHVRLLLWISNEFAPR